MSTPESKVKLSINRVLKSFGVYFFMPVQTGYGMAGVDYHCGVRYGDLCLGFFIEAKKEEKEPTARQDNFLRERREKQNAKTFVIDGNPVTLQELVKWLEEIEDYNERYDQAAAADV